MKYVFGFVRLLASTFLYLLFLLTFLHWCGYDFRVEYNRMEIGLRSSDGKYKILELSDESNRYTTFAILQCDEEGDLDDELLFVTDHFWHGEGLAQDYGWLGQSHDFYIDSIFYGRQIYAFDGETWREKER